MNAPPFRDCRPAGQSATGGRNGDAATTDPACVARAALHSNMPTLTTIVAAQALGMPAACIH
jgi:hypothetical protein